ncbi:hypothetical protein PGN57_05270 [Klebsiella aerogenes]|uniref:hypothetical protein n=1 Tax=Klebsiella aerogenes TaxID=548 RepID=UPI00063C3621|nr:hypothetical protein [Klebsiella aerogenes]KLE49946.1 hypothetical protein YA13_01970 [Klebsiella aerogenes]
MQKTVLLSLAVLASPLAIAANMCTPNLTGFDVCEKAKEIASQVRPQLPLTLSENVNMYDIRSDQNKLIAKVRLGMTEDEMLEAAAQNHITPGMAKNRLGEMAKSGVCTGKNPIGSFIRLGGEMRYIYTHPSGATYTTVDITSCK